VIGLPHPDFGEAVTAVVAARQVDTALIITSSRNASPITKCRSGSGGQ